MRRELVVELPVGIDPRGTGQKGGIPVVDTLVAEGGKVHLGGTVDLGVAPGVYLERVP